MVLTIGVLLLLCLIGFGIKNKNDGYFTIDETSSIEGVFVFVIFFSHVCGIIHSFVFYDSAATYFYQSAISQLMVAPFFFFSAYGIVRQYALKGRKNYLSNFPFQRILKVYLIYIICEIVGELTLALFQGFQSFKFDPLLFTIWNGSWFVFVIIVLYILIFLSLLLFGEKKKFFLLLLFVLSITFAICLIVFGKQPHWFNTIIAFPLGSCFALYKDKFDKLINCKKAALILLVASIILYVCLTIVNWAVDLITIHVSLYLLVYYLIVFVFMLGIINFLKCFKFGNIILITLSKYSLYSYVLQFFVFRFFIDVVELLSVNRYLYVFVTVLVTIMFSFLLKFVVDIFFRFTLNKLRFCKEKEISK